MPGPLCPAEVLAASRGGAGELRTRFVLSVKDPQLLIPFIRWPGNLQCWLFPRKVPRTPVPKRVLQIRCFGQMDSAGNCGQCFLLPEAIPLQKCMLVFILSVGSPFLVLRSYFSPFFLVWTFFIIKITLFYVLHRHYPYLG